MVVFDSSKMLSLSGKQPILTRLRSIGKLSNKGQQRLKYNKIAIMISKTSNNHFMKIKFILHHHREWLVVTTCLTCRTMLPKTS